MVNKETRNTLPLAGGCCKNTDTEPKPVEETEMETTCTGMVETTTSCASKTSCCNQ